MNNSSSVEMCRAHGALRALRWSVFVADGCGSNVAGRRLGRIHILEGIEWTVRLP